MSLLVNKSTKSFNGFNNDDDDDDGYTVGGPPMFGLSCLLYPDPNNWSRVSVTSLKLICGGDVLNIDLKKKKSIFKTGEDFELELVPKMMIIKTWQQYKLHRRLSRVEVIKVKPKSLKQLKEKTGLHLSEGRDLARATLSRMKMPLFSLWRSSPPSSCNSIFSESTPFLLDPPTSTSFHKSFISGIFSTFPTSNILNLISSSPAPPKLQLKEPQDKTDWWPRKTITRPPIHISWANGKQSEWRLNIHMLGILPVHNIVRI